MSDRFAIGGRVCPVMTAEAPRKIHMAQVIGISSSRDLQVWEYVSVVNGEYCLTGTANVFRTLGVKIWIALLVILFEGSW